MIKMSCPRGILESLLETQAETIVKRIVTMKGGMCIMAGCLHPGKNKIEVDFYGIHFPVYCCDEHNSILLPYKNEINADLIFKPFIED